MKALILEKPGKAKIIETKKPLVKSGDVLVKVSFSGICATDLAIYEGTMNHIVGGDILYPIRIGHEWSGIVEKVGDNVTHFRTGDRVVSDSGIACGECEFCMSGDYDSCENIRSLGTINDCWDGSFAEYISMPERHLHKLPREISLEEAALIEPASIALAGLSSCDVKGKLILIIGTGPIGLAAVPMARAMGAKKIIISGRKKSKLAVAKEVGADIAVDITCENLEEIIMDETMGKGAHVVIETSGNIITINQSVRLARRGGTVALIGFYGKTHNNFNIDEVVIKAVHLVGIAGEFGMPAKVIQFMKDNNISFKPLITHRFEFSDIISAFDTAINQSDSRIKVMVNFL